MRSRGRISSVGGKGGNRERGHEISTEEIRQESQRE